MYSFKYKLAILLVVWETSSIGAAPERLQYRHQVTNSIYQRMLAQKFGAQYKVPVNRILATIKVESQGNPAAKSPRGCMGLMQIEPATAIWLKCVPRDGVNLLYNQEVNVSCGVKYLAYLYELTGNWEAAHWAYNQGPRLVLGQQGLAPTISYVQKVALAMRSSAKVTRNTRHRL